MDESGSIRDNSEILKFHGFHTLCELGLPSSHVDSRERFERTEWVKSDAIPMHSIVIPVHNMSEVISGNLIAACSNLEFSSDLIIVLDDCTDSSKIKVVDTIDSLLGMNQVGRIVLLESSVSMFETLSDALGITFALGEFVIEIQADMLIQERGWDSRLIAPLVQFEDIFCVSGRGCHLASHGQKMTAGESSTFNPVSQFLQITDRILRALGIVNNLELFFRHCNSFGLCDSSIEARWVNRPLGKVFLSETVMRGPLAFRLDRYQCLGGLDTTRFFLGEDDHDLVNRAWSARSWRSGYVPIKFSAPLAHGATRRKKSEKEMEEFTRVSSLYGGIVSSALSTPLPSREVRKVHAL